MPLPRWGKLPEVISRCTSAGMTEHEAKVWICQAIGHGAVDIRARLGKHVNGISTAHKIVLKGSDFHVPTEIQPDQLDWNQSRPTKPWVVRRESFRPHGGWNLDWIKLSLAQVSELLGDSKEAPPASVSYEAIPVNRNQRRVTGGPSRPRGPPPLKRQQTIEAMRDNIRQGTITEAQLAAMKEEALSARYGVSRDTARKARKAVLSALGDD